jgi:hypothetical protein
MSKTEPNLIGKCLSFLKYKVKPNVKLLLINGKFNAEPEKKTELWRVVNLVAVYPFLSS